MNEWNNLLAEGSLIKVITSALALLFTIQSITGLLDWFCKKFGIETRRTLSRRQEAAMLSEHDKTLGTIKEEIHSTHDKIKVLSQMMVDMQNKADATEQARLKDRISQGYRIYHERKTWTQMEKDAFEGLIRDYELHGGKNSFVHSICEPESWTWTMIKN